MGDELQKRLLSYLDAAERGIREAGPAVGGELEALVREWLTWMFWQSVGTAAACFALAAVLAVVLRWLWRVAGRTDDGVLSDAFRIVGILVLGPGLLGACGVGFHEGMHAVKVRMAPRVVVLEEVARLVKPGASK